MLFKLQRISSPDASSSALIEAAFFKPYSKLPQQPQQCSGIECSDTCISVPQFVDLIHYVLNLAVYRNNNNV